MKANTGPGDYQPLAAAVAPWQAKQAADDYRRGQVTTITRVIAKLQEAGYPPAKVFQLLQGTSDLPDPELRQLILTKY